MLHGWEENCKPPLVRPEEARVARACESYHMDLRRARAYAGHSIFASPRGGVGDGHGAGAFLPGWAGDLRGRADLVAGREQVIRGADFVRGFVRVGAGVELRRAAGIVERSEGQDRAPVDRLAGTGGRRR